MMVTRDDIEWLSRKLERFSREHLLRLGEVPTDRWARERILADIIHEARAWADIHDQRKRFDAALDDVDVTLLVDPSENAPILRIHWRTTIEEPFNGFDAEYERIGEDQGFGTVEVGGQRIYAWVAAGDDIGATMTPSQARELADALVAAACAAERMGKP